jgi:hypothetical protein
VALADQGFQALIAFGAAPYEDGGHIDSFRFVFGTTSGF